MGMDGGAIESRQADQQIGELLLQQGKLSRAEIGDVLAVARRDQLRFGEAAIRLGLLSEDELLTALSQQFAYPVLEPGSSPLHPSLVVAYQPHSAAAETWRGLRTQLRQRWFTGERRLLALCAPDAGDGCSAAAANLAIAFAQLGEKTLLIDCDLRTPAQRDLFGLAPGPGVSGLLAGRCSARDAITPIGAIPGLSLLGAGAPPPNPQELLGKSQFRDLLTRLGTLYSVVIVDTPPASASADTQSIAAVAGGALLIGRRHHTRLDGLQQLKDTLLPGGIAIVGAVVRD